MFSPLISQLNWDLLKVKPPVVQSKLRSQCSPHIMLNRCIRHYSMANPNNLNFVAGVESQDFFFFPLNSTSKTNVVFLFCWNVSLYFFFNLETHKNQNQKWILEVSWLLKRLQVVKTLYLTQPSLSPEWWWVLGIQNSYFRLQSVGRLYSFAWCVVSRQEGLVWNELCVWSQFFLYLIQWCFRELSWLIHIQLLMQLESWLEIGIKWTYSAGSRSLRVLFWGVLCLFLVSWNCLLCAELSRMIVYHKV